MSNRIEYLRNHVDSLMKQRGGQGSWQCFYQMHMYAVSIFAAMLADKRGLDSELATMIGLLHDIYPLLTGDTENHAKNGSILAREILTDLDIVDDEELDIICTAVKYHSKKRAVHDEYSELAKDADVLSHYYHDISWPILEKDHARLEALKVELGLR